MVNLFKGHKMNRRIFLKNLGIDIAALSLPGCYSSSQAGSITDFNGKKPNIVFILADDIGWAAVRR